MGSEMCIRDRHTAVRPGAYCCSTYWCIRTVVGRHFNMTEKSDKVRRNTQGGGMEILCSGPKEGNCAPKVANVIQGESTTAPVGVIQFSKTADALCLRTHLPASSGFLSLSLSPDMGKSNPTKNKSTCTCIPLCPDI